jgi:hypothetical protein
VDESALSESALGLAPLDDVKRRSPKELYIIK